MSTSTTLKHRIIISLVLVLLFGTTHTIHTVYAHEGNETSNCTPTDYHIHGQTHGGVSGTEGATFDTLEEAWERDEGANPGSVEDIEPEDLEPGPDEISARAQTIPMNTTVPVAILIVDDFQNKNPEADPSLSHGDFVSEIFDAALAALSGAHDVSNISLYTVDVGLLVDGSPESHYRTDVIDSEIADMIDSLRFDGINRFVINMSFAVMPCHAGINAETRTVTPYMRAEDVDANTIYFDFFNYRDMHTLFPVVSLSEYFEFLSSQPGVVAPSFTGTDVEAYDGAQTPFADEVLPQLLSSSSGGSGTFNPQMDRFSLAKSPAGSQVATLDPLQALLQDLLTESEDLLQQTDMQANEETLIVIPVASAGNFGGSAGRVPPLEPGSWDEVISVSASIGNDGRPWASTNNGELMTVGGWHQFSDGRYRAGTSFSAPVESALIATYLSNNGVLVCNFRPGIPLFAYPGDYRDQSFADALADYCP
jgi:hypothetical protein